MHVISSPIQHIKLCRAHKNQKRTALRMLAVSGVVRASHVEIHYATPIARLDAFRRHPAATEHQQTHPLPLPSWDHDITVNIKETRQWARSLPLSLLQVAKKLIVFPWTKQLGL
ncbi:MAG: hypothetical protein ABI988_14365 [Nitrospirota bacterium]